jgi:predicted lactoylglutathione lyase
MSREIFINLPVRDLDRSMAFFKKLGFEFNPQFTDSTAACMIFNDKAYAMLITEKRFLDFVAKKASDPLTSTEKLVAFSAASRDEVNRIADLALASGGSPATDPTDHGFMYYRTFFDPDGHHWEVVWMDPATTR